MYKEPLFDTSPAKVLAIIITVFIFFVIPAQLITLYKNDPEEFKNNVTAIQSVFIDDVSVSEEQGKVAGESTSINQPENRLIEDRSFIFGGIGFFLLIFSIGAIGYLIKIEKNYKIKNHKK